MSTATPRKIRLACSWDYDPTLHGGRSATVCPRLPHGPKIVFDSGAFLQPLRLTRQESGVLPGIVMQSLERRFERMNKLDAI